MDNYREYGLGGEYADFKKIKVGVKQLDDATIKLGDIPGCMPKHQFTDKRYILRALGENNLEDLRAISNFYYNLQGIYRSVCRHFAFLYRYDWYVTPEIFDETVKEEKVLKDFAKVLNFLDNSHLKKVCGDIALKVIKEGCYYGYLVESAEGIV
jgi:hypothetical protein